MRVISGQKRGLKLNTISGVLTRPTSDRLKETLFNIINFHIPDSIFIDFFSGSGSIGIEALSRGAKKCYFVDENKDCTNIIMENLKKCDFLKNSYVINDCALNSFKYFENNCIKASIVFLDPPYFSDIYEEIIYNIQKFDLLCYNGIIIVERNSNHKINYNKNFHIYKQKQFKTTTFDFLRRT